jgi:hypothetical protein
VYQGLRHVRTNLTQDQVGKGSMYPYPPFAPNDTARNGRYVR